MDALRYFFGLPYAMMSPAHLGPVPSSAFVTDIESGVVDGTRDVQMLSTLVRLGSSEMSPTIDAGLLLASTILRSLAMLFLVLALRWQLRYRSDFQKDEPSDSHESAFTSGDALSTERHWRAKKPFQYRKIATEELSDDDILPSGKPQIAFLIAHVLTLFLSPPKHRCGCGVIVAELSS
jgi:hypothetical protein